MQYHEYVGVPPLVGTAFSVTLLPEHIVLLGIADMVTFGTSAGFTRTVILVVTELGTGQASLEVMIHVIVLVPGASVLLLYTGLVVGPATVVPFIWKT